MSTKSQARVSAHGFPIRLRSQPATRPMRYPIELLEGMTPGNDAMADRGYDYAAMLDAIAAGQVVPHVPTTLTRFVQRSTTTCFTASAT